MFLHLACILRNSKSNPFALPFACLSQVVVTSYIPDQALDMFQLGRLAVKQNDFCFRGPLTSNERGQFCGPVSRYAARIMCERTPPYSTWICAAGFDNKKDIFLSEGAPKWKEEDGEGEDWDAVTTFGLRIWQPSVGKWVEVSVNGYMHEVRETDDVCGPRINNSLARLEHGSIVDFSGVQVRRHTHTRTLSKFKILTPNFSLLLLRCSSSPVHLPRL